MSFQIHQNACDATIALVPVHHQITFTLNRDYVSTYFDENAITRKARLALNLPSQITSLSTPIKSRLVDRIMVDGEEANVIYSEDTPFTSGHWVFVDPFLLFDYVAINASSGYYDMLAMAFLNNAATYTSEASFLMAALSFFRNNINRGELLGFYDRSKPFVCRHYATFALPFFARILSSKRRLFKGTIQLMDARPINKLSLQTDDGHVWNFITITSKHDNSKSYWHIDPLTGHLIKIVPNAHIDELMVIDLNSDDFYSHLGDYPTIKPYVQATIEKFRLETKVKRNLMSDFIADDMDLEEKEADDFTINYRFER